MELLLQRNQQPMKQTFASQSEEEESPKCSGLLAAILLQIWVEIDCFCHSQKSCDKTLREDFDYTIKGELDQI